MSYDEYHNILPEEAEYNFEKMLEYLEKCPSYMLESREDFVCNPTKIGAKKLWLQFVEKGEPVPDDVVKVLFETIKKEIEDYDLQHTDGVSQRNRVICENCVFELLNTAKEDLDSFWKLLHGPTKSVITPCSDILETLRIWLPKRRQFKAGEIFAIFEGLLDEPPTSPKIASSEPFQQKFRRWRTKKITYFEK